MLLGRKVHVQMNDSLKWSNLKRNRCPKCNKDWLKMGNAKFGNGIITCRCSFFISEKRMAEIVNDKVGRELEEYSDEDIRLD